MARVLCLFNRAALHRFCIFDFRAVLICVYIVVIFVCTPKDKLFGHIASPLFNLPIPRAVSRFFSLALPYTVNINYIIREVSTLSVIIRPQLPPKHGRRKRPKNRIVKRSRTFLCNLLLALQP